MPGRSSGHCRGCGSLVDERAHLRAAVPAVLIIEDDVQGDRVAELFPGCGSGHFPQGVRHVAELEVPQDWREFVGTEECSFCPGGQRRRRTS